jgi:hypothetical protein
MAFYRAQGQKRTRCCIGEYRDDWLLYMSYMCQKVVHLRRKLRYESSRHKKMWVLSYEEASRDWINCT